MKKENDINSKITFQRAVIKSLLKSKKNQKYENEVAYILHGKDGVYYENKIYPHDYSYSTSNFKIKEISDEELRKLISRLRELKSIVNKKNTSFFYYGMMYNKKDFYELCYNFKRNQKEYQGQIKEELPITMKIKIYSDIETIFDNNIKNGIRAILRLKDKNILLEISHDEGYVLTKI